MVRLKWFRIPRRFSATNSTGRRASLARSAKEYPSRISTVIPPAPSTSTMSETSAALAIAPWIRPVSIVNPSRRAARWGGSGADRGYRQTSAGGGRRAGAGPPAPPVSPPAPPRLRRPHGKPLPPHRFPEQAGDVRLPRPRIGRRDQDGFPGDTPRGDTLAGD